ncbi:MAG: hypothetical protein RLZZ553_933 [Verrucomicrobiota bacterium]|jgi:hypothetical protein
MNNSTHDDSTTPPTNDDKQEWWYHDNEGEKQGPVSLEDLLTLHEDCDIDNETLIMREGASEWRSFRDLLNKRVVACKHFNFICGKRWKELKGTESFNVRYCNDCAKQVHLCESVFELHEHSRLGHCVAYRVPDEYPEFLLGDLVVVMNDEPNPRAKQ